MNDNKIGISIITGFLGAGKTSLINKIIAKESIYKFAIIENEFGAQGIDGEIISGIDSNNIFELSNGCICCTMNTELQETIVQLFNSNAKFSYLLIETTGIAEPDAIVQSVISNLDLKQEFYIDSVICLVDAINFKRDISTSEAIKQVAMADFVLLNKVENSSSEAILEIKASIRQINPLCKIIPSSFSEYDNEQIIAIQSFNYKEFEQTFVNIRVDREKAMPHLSVKSISIEIEGEFIHEKFNFWMEYFLMLNQNNIYRAKGILNFNGASRKFIFQAVKASFSIEEGDFWKQSEPRKNRIIFIGKELNKSEIMQGIQSLMVD